MSPILPIDSGRYGTAEMRGVFSEESRLQKMLDVEAALAWALGKVGDIPQKDARRIVQRATTTHVRPSRVNEIEREIKHDVMALVRALAEVCESSGGYVHLGATSSDILDTATALQLREAINIIEGRLRHLEAVTVQGCARYKGTIMIGRTHGQHALPTTLGFKFAVWTRELARHLQRLQECKKRIFVGKISGAVGTQAGLGANALKIQELAMKRLKLTPVEISTQIIQRDRHAELVCLLALIASTLDKIATEIRELQRPEIAEVFEPFDKEKQVGSSTMPHKRNPIVCERVSGLAKVLRSLPIIAFENVPTWHERDISQSSAERFMVPEACILADHLLVLMIDVLTGLEVNQHKMLENLNLTQGLIMSEAVMLALARKGMDRQKAHELIRRLAIESDLENKPFRELVVENEAVKKRLTEEEVDNALNPLHYLGTATRQIERVIEITKQERKKDRLAG